MKITDVPKFDPSVFTAAELKGLQALTDRCVKAKSRAAIDVAGAKLDTARQTQREKSRKAAIRAHSLNALYKRLILEVPRPPVKPTPDEVTA